MTPKLSPKVREFLARDYPISTEIELVEDGSQIFASWFIDLPGCIAQGSSFAEALTRLLSILPAYLDELDAQKVGIPDPTRPTINIHSMGFYDYTGRPPALRPEDVANAKTSPARQVESQSSSLVGAAA